MWEIAMVMGLVSHYCFIREYLKKVTVLLEYIDPPH